MERSSSREGGKGDLKMAASGVRQLSDKEKETVEEAQPTPPPRKKKLEKLLRKQIEENQKLTKSVESSVFEREDEAGEADNTTPPGTTPRKARKKTKHSK
jgi:Ni,Fe-hydrogenase I large subunit